jgi:hypothetical protein
MIPYGIRVGWLLLSTTPLQSRTPTMTQQNPFFIVEEYHLFVPIPLNEEIVTHPAMQ